MEKHSDIPCHRAGDFSKKAADVELERELAWPKARRNCQR